MAFASAMVMAIADAGSAYAANQTAKAVLTANVLTFYYDDVDHSTEGAVYPIADDGSWDCADRATVIRAVLDDSFADFAPTSLEGFFQGFTILATLDGPDNLNTSAATSMKGMFRDCSSLAGLDASSWDTSSVTDLSEMFAFCWSLESVDVSMWDTSKVNDLYRMFTGCQNLTRLDLTGWDVSSVTLATEMFKDCSGLETIRTDDSFDLTCLGDWGENIFDGCSSLVGGCGTAFDSDYPDAERACVDDDSADKLGYFTSPYSAGDLKSMFTDVIVEGGDHWVIYEPNRHMSYLGMVVERGMMGGYTGTDLFGPDDLVTRAQAAVILYRSACASDPTLQATSGSTTDPAYYASEPVFDDEAGGVFYTAAVNWAKDVGVLSGYGPDYRTVRPDASISRQELAVLLYRYAVGAGADATSDDASSYASAPDAASVADWASKGVGWCYYHKVMTGSATAGTLDPEGAATRAVMAKMAVVSTNLIP